MLLVYIATMALGTQVVRLNSGICSSLENSMSDLVGVEYHAVIDWLCMHVKRVRVTVSFNLHAPSTSASTLGIRIKVREFDWLQKLGIKHPVPVM